VPESFFQVTVVPEVTVRVVGEKLDPPIQNVFAGQVAGGGGGGGGVMPPSPPPPQEIAVTTKTKAPIKPEIFRILPPRRAESGFTVSHTALVARNGHKILK
jgi:hypothetical protein